MSDSVEKALARRIERWTALAEAELAKNTPALETVATVRLAADAVPWRAGPVSWEPRVSNATAIDPAVSCACMTPMFATRVHAWVDLDLDAGSGGQAAVDSADKQVRGLARGVADCFEQTVLDEIVREAVRGGEYEYTAVNRRLSAPGRWTLVGAGEVAQKISAAGRAKVVAPDGLLDKVCDALLVPTLAPPVVERVDSPTLVWSRLEQPPGRVRVTVQRQFFVEDAGRAVVFAPTKKQPNNAAVGGAAQPPSPSHPAAS